MTDSPSHLLRNKPTTPSSAPVAIIDPTVEYWSRREPYLSTGRTFGRVELISAYYHEKSPTLFVRGWIFDRQGPLSSLQLYSPDGEPSTTVSQLVRKDVSQAFPHFSHARLSGFAALLPTKEIHGQLRIRGSYTCGDTIVNFVFEEQPVSLGIAQPGQTIDPPPLDTPDSRDAIALIITPGWQLPQELLETFERCSRELGSPLWIFSDTTPHGDLDSLVITETGVIAPVSSTASVLWGRSHQMRRVLVVGPLDTTLITRQILPLIAGTPTPRLSWIVPSEGSLPISTLIQGGCIQFLELQSLTLPDSIRDLL